MGIADGAQILVADSARNLVAGEDYRFSEHGAHDLKRFEEPVRPFELCWKEERPCRAQRPTR